MGNKQKKIKERRKKELSKSEKIEKALEQEKEFQKQEIKFLLLGTGESGKSTFIKQLELIYKTGFDNEKRELYRRTIQKNLILHTKHLIHGTEILGTKIKNETKKLTKGFLEIDETKPLTLELSERISKIWEDNGIKKVFRSRSTLQIPDSASYYLNDIKRIMKVKYQPTDKDILYCRIPTTGIVKVQFKVNDFVWTIVDVGGQRSERRKWIHQFDDVSVLIYVVALSEYDQKLYEDETINRMHESLETFDNTANNSYFLRTSCILIFNKMDLFEEKIQKVDPRTCFRDYRGGLNAEKAKKFVSEKFKNLGQNKKRKVKMFFTTATITRNMTKIFWNTNYSHIVKFLFIIDYLFLSDSFLSYESRGSVVEFRQVP
ncbi:guanine nucleotide-binding protein g(o) subunit alpha [Anaeramoeba flamelloides]|uniref:Guanine nucleotide-binding protein g(O) subunit alpha n=1 Tax=Anaeramoeba flamelloides TaxID=1746091 RepID=A0AAV8AFK4_9EUKA|nr:guanine nucleotide-binding protein g(o) subunit alpha [Anaeramoeba flamelloides]